MMRTQIVFSDDAGVVVGTAFPGPRCPTLAAQIKYAAKIAPLAATQLAIVLVRACRLCGCTDDHACMTNGAPCHWVEPDLCSACQAAYAGAGGAL